MIEIMVRNVCSLYHPKTVWNVYSMWYALFILNHILILSIVIEMGKGEKIQLKQKNENMIKIFASTILFSSKIHKIHFVFLHDLRAYMIFMITKNALQILCSVTIIG